jgi:hypothetical protein
MLLYTWSAAIKRKMQTAKRDRSRSAGPKHRWRPVLENLEDRIVPTNLIVNGGFETGTFAGWTQGGNMGFTSVNGNRPHSGSFAAELGPVGSPGTLAQKPVTTAGATYLLNYWQDHSTGSPMNQWHVLIDGAALPGGDIPLPGAGPFPYTQHFAKVKGTGNPAGQEVKFVFQEDPDYWYLDDVSFSDARIVDTTVAGLGVHQGLFEADEGPTDPFSYAYVAIRITDGTWDPGSEGIWLMQEDSTGQSISDVAYVIDQRWDDIGPNPVATVWLFSDSESQPPIPGPPFLPDHQVQIFSNAPEDFQSMATLYDSLGSSYQTLIHAFSDTEDSADPSDFIDITPMQNSPAPHGGSGGHVAFDTAAVGRAVFEYVPAAPLVQIASGQATQAALPAQPAAGVDQPSAPLASKDGSASLPLPTLVASPAIDQLGLISPIDDLGRL